MQNLDIKELFGAPVQTLTSLTVNLIRMKRYEQVEQCLLVVEKILSGREETLKALLVDCFVPAIADCLERCDWKEAIIALFPVQVKKKYELHYSGNLLSETVIINEYRDFLIHLN